MTFNKDTRTLVVDARYEKRPSMHTVKMTLTAKDQTFEMSFLVKVVMQTQNSVSGSKLTARFESISTTGLVQIRFSEQIIPAESKALEKVTDALILNVYVYDYDSGEYKQSAQQLKYVCVKLDGIIMLLQVTFNSPELLSLGKVKDQLWVVFANPSLFMTENGFTKIDQDYRVVGTIEPQFKDEA
jgi:hypothetical protein